MRAEAADRAFLYRDEQFVVRRQLADKIKVQRLGEPHVRNGGRKPHRIQLRRRRFRLAKPGAERKQRDLLALPADSPRADLKALRLLVTRKHHPRTTPQDTVALPVGRTVWHAGVSWW